MRYTFRIALFITKNKTLISKYLMNNFQYYSKKKEKIQLKF